MRIAPAHIHICGGLWRRVLILMGSAHHLSLHDTIGGRFGMKLNLRYIDTKQMFRSPEQQECKHNGYYLVRSFLFSHS
jgi:hypothetical protein